jgi:hydrogenase expression/formation protein HypE
MKTILLDHGSGGRASQQLIGELFLSYLDDPVLHRLEDSAVLEPQTGRLAFSTDSYVVDPIFFPGGNIGELAVNGTINDLAMRGARPLCLSLGLILEEGLALDDLEQIIAAIALSSKTAGVPIVTGDTKVVPRGKADKIFINTSGIGIVDPGCEITAEQAREGDKIILSGSLADHGITILTRRAGLQVAGELKSDTMALHTLVALLNSELPGAVHTLRDPTRGGLATTLSEIADTAHLCMMLDESAIPVRPAVAAACELMGLDPLYLANEGKCMALVAADRAEKVLALMRTTREGRDAAIIGEVTAEYPGKVVLKTSIGGERLVEPLSGEPLPRIC